MVLPPIGTIIAEYEQARAADDDRGVAETAYALAHRYIRIGDIDRAEQYAQAGLAAAERLPSDHLDDVVCARPNVGGVPMPDYYFHEGVIRSRLGGLLVSYDQL